MNAKPGSPVAPGNRFMSLDFFRGLTMFLLIAESTEIYDHLVDPALTGTILASIGAQFHHHPWNGLRFFDSTATCTSPPWTFSRIYTLVSRPVDSW